MSRVAKMPVIVPAGVDVVFKEDHINVKGALGTVLPRALRKSSTWLVWVSRLRRKAPS